jgi:hypothetical protein
MRGIMLIDKETARKIYVMIDSGLIWYKHYFLWCQSLIKKGNTPPWIEELSKVEYIGDAKRIVNDYAFSFEDMVNGHNVERYNKYFLSCLYLRYKRNEISWATFLNEAGKYSDINACDIDCEYFFDKLTKFEDSLFSSNLEKTQSNIVVNRFLKESLDDVLELYNEFKMYFIQYVNNRKNIR